MYIRFRENIEKWGGKGLNHHWVWIVIYGNSPCIPFPSYGCSYDLKVLSFKHKCGEGMSFIEHKNSGR